MLLPDNLSPSHQHTSAFVRGAGIRDLAYGLGPTFKKLFIPREETTQFWSIWAQTLVLPSVRPELVKRSALVLRSLFHGPTGAIAAAATTSLPEHLGGIRNWDYRYRCDDGIAGIEGGFNLCTAWLIGAYAAIGRRDAAEALFEQHCALTGPMGLMSEQYGPVEKVALGNFPLVYCHFGLINVAVRISES